MDLLIRCCVRIESTLSALLWAQFKLNVNAIVQVLHTETDFLPRINDDPRPGQEMVWKSMRHMISISNDLL